MVAVAALCSPTLGWHFEMDVAAERRSKPPPPEHLHPELPLMLCCCSLNGGEGGNKKQKTQGGQGQASRGVRGEVRTGVTDVRVSTGRVTVGCTCWCFPDMYFLQTLMHQMSNSIV